MPAKPRSQDRKILSNAVISLCFWNGIGSLCTPVIRRLGHREQEFKHLLCPGLFFLLSDKQTVSQEMGSTQAVSACIVIIAGPTVVHDSALKVRPDPYRFQRLLPAFAVPAVESQQACRVHMDPMQESFDAYSRFISMLKRGGDQQGFEMLDGWLQLLGSFSNPIHQGGF